MTAVVRVAKPRPTHSDRAPIKAPTVKNVPKIHGSDAPFQPGWQHYNRCLYKAAYRLKI